LTSPRMLLSCGFACRRGQGAELRKALGSAVLDVSYSDWKYAFDLAPLGILITNEEGWIEHANMMMSELSKMNSGQSPSSSTLYFCPSKNVYFPMMLHIWNVVIFVQVKISCEDMQVTSKLFRWEDEDCNFQGPVYKHGMSCEIKVSSTGGGANKVFVYLKHSTWQ